MAFHEIETHWMGKMQFNTLVQGHTLIMDAPERIGGEDLGPIPKPLILSSLSGCTGMDIVHLLKKKGKSLKNFSMSIKGELSKTIPMEYISIHLIYFLEGSEEDQGDSIQAIMDSQEKICGVSHMLKKIMPVSWEIHYNGKKVYESFEMLTLNPS